MPLINCKIELSLKRYENCILSSAWTAVTFAITDTKLYVPILKTEDNAKLSKLLNEGFKRSIYWNKYKIIFKDYNNEYIRERLDATFQGVSRLFVLVYARGDDVTNEIDGRNFYDESIDDLIKQYDEVRKITGQGGDYTTGCLLDFAYFKKKNYRLICSWFK